MKLHKIKTLAGAVALWTLSTAGSVFAGFTGTQGNSSVLFNTYESVSGYSCALDTDLRKDDITSSFTGVSFNLATDAN
ncbi:MAG: hypothetical protein ABIN99_08470 [Nitrosospira sp.]